VDIAPVGLEVDDWIPNDLPGSVLRHIAAASGLEHVDPQLTEPLARGDDVGATTITTNAKSDDRRMLKEEEQVGNPPRLAFLHQGALEGERLPVRNHAEAPNLKETHTSSELTT